MADHEKLDPFQMPQGPFNPKKIRSWGMLAAGGGLLVAMLVWQGQKKSDAKPDPPSTASVTIPPAPTGTNQPSGPLEKASTSQGPAPASAEVSPAEQRRQQEIDKRRELELRAAFASSVVAVDHPKPQVPIAPQAAVEPVGLPPQPAPEKQDLLPVPPNQTLYTLPEHTVIPALLDTQIQSEISGPLDAIVSMDVYLPNSQIIVIPAGAKLLGESKGVSALGQQRMAVTFHRIVIYPIGAMKPYAISLDETPGEDQAGGVGLHDKVNNHYASIFGASIAIGLISGLSEIGSYSRNNYSAQYGFYNGLSVASGENAMRVLDRFLNRLPTLEIRQGTRMIVETMKDIQVPEYAAAR